jgi:hypothetical protein
MHGAAKFLVNEHKRAKIVERGQKHEPALSLTNILSIFIIYNNHFLLQSTFTPIPDALLPTPLPNTNLFLTLPRTPTFNEHHYHDHSHQQLYLNAQNPYTLILIIRVRELQYQLPAPLQYTLNFISLLLNL